MREEIIRNGWSQGCVLKFNQIPVDCILCKEGKFKETTLLLVISQSCDVVNDIEKNVECLVLRKIREKDYKVELTKGLNPRKLHIEYLGLFYEINAYEFAFIKKQHLVNCACEQGAQLHVELLNIVKSFKANRYIRTGLPEKAAQLIEQSIFKSEDLKKTLSEKAHTLHSIRVQVLEASEDRYSVAVIVLVKQQYFDEFSSFWEETLEKLILEPMRQIDEILLIDVSEEYGLADVMNASEFGIELAPKFPRFFYDALSMNPESFDDVSDE